MSHINIFELVVNKDFDTLLSLLKENPQLFEQKHHLGYTIVHVCTENAPMSIFSKLIELGANINVQDSENETPFCWAVREANFEVADYLLSLGVVRDVRCKTNGNFPIHSAALYGDNSVITYLLSTGVSVDQRNLAGATALHCACLVGESSSVELLLKNGADVNATTNDSRTPLHWAARGHKPSNYLGFYLDTIDILMEHGANYDIQDEDGKTPYDVATPRVKAHLKKYKTR